MKNPHIIAILLITLFVVSCQQKNNPSKEIEEIKEEIADSVLFSFSFVGCNRIDRHDTSSSNPSTANTYALQRIFDDVTSKKNPPELFFFLGDLVLAESTLVNLDTQLTAWKALYENDSISSSSIEMVAVPGNHEMLYSKELQKSVWKEFPLKGSTDIWLNYMKNYMPSSRDQAPSTNLLDNRLTFSFIRHNVGFIVMNTDTYNPPTVENPYGLEGQVPVDWVLQKVTAYKANPNVEHIFVLGHRPYYVGGLPDTGHGGLPQGPKLWPAFEKAGVVAMLSAHQHDYERWQPVNDSLGGGTYQVVAGNGGSVNNRHVPHSPPFFGYSTITVMSSGELQLNSVGYCTGDTYLTPVPKNRMVSRDSIVLTWEQNPNTFPDPYKGCE